MHIKCYILNTNLLDIKFSISFNLCGNTGDLANALPILHKMISIDDKDVNVLTDLVTLYTVTGDIVNMDIALGQLKNLDPANEHISRLETQRSAMLKKLSQ